jgi:hypothetical protein
MIFMFTKNAWYKDISVKSTVQRILSYGTVAELTFFCVGKYTKRRKMPRKGVGTTHYGELAIR